MAESRLDALLRRRTEERRTTAILRARSALDWLSQQGVEAAVIGSLARGGFKDHSDVDFLVLSCPPHLRYALETGVEAVMEDLPFDLVYLDEVKAPHRTRMLEEAVLAPDLR